MTEKIFKPHVTHEVMLVMNFISADWELHPETQEIARLQHLHQGVEAGEEEEDDEEEDDEDVSEGEENSEGREESEGDSDNSPVTAGSSNPFALLAEDE